MGKIPKGVNTERKIKKKKKINIKLSEAQRNMKENILILKLEKQGTEIQYEIVEAPGHFSSDQFLDKVHFFQGYVTLFLCAHVETFSSIVETATAISNLYIYIFFLTRNWTSVILLYKEEECDTSGHFELYMSII